MKNKYFISRDQYLIQVLDKNCNVEVPHSIENGISWTEDLISVNVKDLTIDQIDYLYNKYLKSIEFKMTMTDYRKSRSYNWGTEPMKEDIYLNTILKQYNRFNYLFDYKYGIWLGYTTEDKETCLHNMGIEYTYEEFSNRFKVKYTDDLNDTDKKLIYKTYLKMYCIKYRCMSIFEEWTANNTIILPYRDSDRESLLLKEDN